jgi:antitoxin HigA-1
MSKNSKFPPVHPGEVLKEEFLSPYEITQYRLAKDIDVPPRRINEIVLHKRAVSPDTALRLSRYFGTTAQFWMNLQSHYDLEVAADKSLDKIEHRVKRFEPKRLEKTVA